MAVGHAPANRRLRYDGRVKKQTSNANSVSDHDALAMYNVVDRIMRRFKLEPGLLAGSLYADLHINDVGLITVLSEPGEWNVRKITQSCKLRSQPSHQRSTGSKSAIS